MNERYISVTDEEYVYFLDTQSEDYKSLEDFEKEEFESAKKDNKDIEEYEDGILQLASDNYWDYVYEYHIEADKVCDLLNILTEENKELREDNDIKFWKLKCMQQFNAKSIFAHEISMAREQGYEVSKQFQDYIDSLEESNKEIVDKNKRLFGDG